jgi:benzoyl-CoA reductase/2-hydroxyglutaryl-CoA dehydratase subunit BcrC/BadD/HgdB
MSEPRTRFKDFVRAELGFGWILALALGIGLLAGSINAFVSIPQAVYSYNRALDKAGLYEFYYDKYITDSKYRDGSPLTSEETEKIRRLREIASASAPPVLGALLMFLAGGALMLMFFFRLMSAMNTRVEKLEKELEEGRKQADCAPV